MSDRQQNLSRRKVVAGVGTVGALAAAASGLPVLRDAAPVEAATAPPLPELNGRYRETDHVLHYYRTARV